MTENDITGALDLSFTVSEEIFGQVWIQMFCWLLLLVIAFDKRERILIVSVSRYVPRLSMISTFGRHFGLAGWLAGWPASISCNYHSIILRDQFGIAIPKAKL